VFGIIRRIAKFRIAGGTKGMSIHLPRYKQYSDFQSTRHLRAPSSLSPRWTGLQTLRTSTDSVRPYRHNHRLWPVSYI
jgi:hypothetical protein